MFKKTGKTTTLGVIDPKKDKQATVQPPPNPQPPNQPKQDSHSK